MMLWLAMLQLALAVDEECLLQSQAVMKESATDSRAIPAGPDGSVKDLVDSTKGVELLSESWNDEHLVLDDFFELMHVNCYDGRGAHTYGLEDSRLLGRGVLFRLR